MAGQLLAAGARLPEMRKTWSGRERYALIWGTELLANPSPLCSEEETSNAGDMVSFINISDFNVNELSSEHKQ
ncbi:hypothetical protein ZWY2020_031365 [Hordeum vulgare]|nr:hypothetical protein ZWY2020_031365 [Hordeum vulgare]